LGQHNTPFWQTKTLDEMSREEWESLCDGCGRCCLVKLEDCESEDVYLTRLSCRLLDTSSCRCGDYPNRHKEVDDCIAIDPEKLKILSWLPGTCAYRCISEGRELSWWHPLVSGTAETVHQAGISVRGWARSETSVEPDDFHRYIIKGFD